MASAPTVKKHLAWEQGKLPLELYWKIGHLADKDGRDALMLVSKAFNRVYAGTQFTEMRFGDQQRQLSEMLRLFIFIHDTEREDYLKNPANRIDKGTNPTFTAHIKAATIEVFEPPYKPGTSSISWETAADYPRARFKPDTFLASRICQAIPLMTNLRYLDLQLEYLTRSQRRLILELMGNSDPWKQVRQLRLMNDRPIINSDDDWVESYIIRRQVCNLEGLQIKVGMDSYQWLEAEGQHRNLKRLHFIADPTDVADWITGRIKFRFKSLEWLSIDTKKDGREQVSSDDLLLQIDRFAEPLGCMTKLQRVALTIGEENINRGLNGDPDIQLCETLVRRLGRNLPRLSHIAILGAYPIYYLGTRDTEGEELKFTIKNVAEQKRASWPSGIGDD